MRGVIVAKARLYVDHVVDERADEEYDRSPDSRSEAIREYRLRMCSRQGGNWTTVPGLTGTEGQQLRFDLSDIMKPILVLGFQAVYHLGYLREYTLLLCKLY